MINAYKSTGQIIRELREGKELLVRQVAALLEIDPSLLSKIERGDKRATRDQISLLSSILEVNENELFPILIFPTMYKWQKQVSLFFNQGFFEKMQVQLGAL